MNSICTRVWRAAALATVLLLGSTLNAQSSTGIVLGSVTDASGASVASASISVKNVETGVTQTTTSDAQGRYRVPELQIGSYEVQASQAGFQTVVRKGITLNVGSEAVIDITLPVGQSQQTVTVEAEASQVDTTSAAVASLVEPTQMRELPLNGRNFEQLMTLAPGVQALPQSGGALFGNQTNVSIAGSRSLGIAYLIDNTNFAGFFNHGTGSAASGSSLGIEAIAEFQTLTNTYSAQFGGSGGAVNAVTKSGGNSFHGSAYEFVRNSAFDARNFFDTVRQPGATGARVPPFKRNQFGGSIGGPIRKDKTFFFVNFESQRQGQENTAIANVPDANAKLGYLPCVTAPTVTCNQSTGLAFVGIAPSIASTLAAFQTAVTPTGGGIGTYTIAPNTITDENYLLVRVDHTISTKDSLFVRYVRDSANVATPAAPVSLTEYVETDATANHFATTEWKRIISPTVVNLARFSFLRPVETGVTPQSISALQWFPGQGRPDGRVAVTGLTQIGPAQQNPFGVITNRYDEGDDVIWTKGAHDMRFGFNVDRIQDNLNISVSTGGQYNFNSLQNFLLGNPSQFTGPPTGQADTYRDVRELRLQPYFQDQWKFSRKLTLNIGVRYEWAANPTERLNKFSTLIHPPFGVFQSVPNAFQNNPTKWNFEPRFGLAYDPFADHKTSVRVGFAMFHDLVMAYLFAPGYLRTPPFTQFNQQNPTPYGQPFLTGGAPALPSAISGSGGVNADYQMGPSPYMMQYNLNIQRDLGNGMILTVGYVGSHGVHLLSASDLNPPTRTFTPDGRPVFATLVGGKITSNPRLNPNFGPYQSSGTWGNSNYNSLQTSLNRRFSHHWQTQVSYTFSKSLDTESGPFVATSAGANTTAQDPYNFNIDHARSTFDRTHAFRFSGIYTAPNLQSHLADAVAGGWQISGLLSAVSGPPFTVNVGFDQAGLANQTPRASLAPGRSNNPILGDPNHWYDVTAFVLPAVGTYGNLGRDTLIGPDLFNADISLSKAFRLRKLSEVSALQFRADIFNILNHANFDLPNNKGGVSFVSGPNGIGTYDPTAGQITKTVTSSRQIQLALKLTF